MSDTTLSQAVTGARIQRSNEVSRAAGGMYSKTGPFEFDITLSLSLVPGSAAEIIESDWSKILPRIFFR